MLTKQEFLKAFLMFLITIPLIIASYIIVPIALLFCKKEDENLPKFLKWFDDLNYGINGDGGWKTEHFPEPKNRSYLARLLFLYRNRINGFQVLHQGMDVKNIDLSTISVQGDTLATYNKGQKDTFCIVRIEANSKKYFSLYYEKRYLKYFYIRAYIGWKLMDIANFKNILDKQKWLENQSKENRLSILESVFSINPFKIIKRS